MIRILISFVGGTLVVLTMLVAGLQLFKARQSATSSQQKPGSAAFQVEYLSPQEAARIVNDDFQRAADPVAPQPDDN